MVANTMRPQPAKTSVAAESPPPHADPMDFGDGAAGALVASAGDSSDVALDNVVPFARPRRSGGVEISPPVGLAERDRPVPPVPAAGERWRLAGFLVASLVVHGSLCAALNREPTPMASLGEEVISVEIVVGANAAAGAAEKSTSETAADDAIASTASQGEITAEESKPIEPDPPLPRDTAAEKPKAEQAKPDQAIEAAEPAAEKVAIATAPQVETSRPETKFDAPAIRATEPNERPKRPKSVSARSESSAPSEASSGVGRGRSDRNVNYRGLVAAHLSRYKHFPTEARRKGVQGNAIVSFELDGAGRVTSVELVRGSGSSALDKEAQEMVRRASPFPPPPGGRAMNFTAPVAFHLN